jgi:Phospholipase_D-nuclease N-terminal
MLQLVSPTALAFLGNLAGPDLIICLIGPLCFIFWIWMLIEAITKEPTEGNDKLIWVIVIALTQVIGAAIYYFVRRPERIRKYGR